MFTVCLNDLTIAELRGLARTDHVCGQRFRGKRCRSQKAASLDVHDLDVHGPRFQPIFNVHMVDLFADTGQLFSYLLN